MLRVGNYRVLDWKLWVMCLKFGVLGWYVLGLWVGNFKVLRVMAPYLMRFIDLLLFLRSRVRRRMSISSWANASVFDGRCLCRSQCVDHLDLLGMVVLGFVRF